MKLTARGFCIWLEGYLFRGNESLTREEVATIREKLGAVVERQVIPAGAKVFDRVLTEKEIFPGEFKKEEPACPDFQEGETVAVRMAPNLPFFPAKVVGLKWTGNYWYVRVISEAGEPYEVRPEAVRRETPRRVT